MSYWHHWQSTWDWGGQLHWMWLAFFGVAFLLTALAPNDRRRIAGSIVLFITAGALLLAAAAVHTWSGSNAGPGYWWLRAAGIFGQAIALINLASVLIFKVILRRLRLEPSPILQDLATAVVFIVVMIGLLTRLGVNLTGIVATSAVVTAVIGFSLQDTLGNIMGGMALQMERSIGVGDWVRIGDQEGVVKEIRWRQTSIETRNWDTVIIPNSQLMKTAVIVLGRRTGQPRQRREHVFFNVDFRHSPTTVIETVESALRSEPIPDIAAEPPPQCILMEFRDSWGIYAARYWLTDIARNDPTNSQVRARIYAALRRAGIGLSIPAQTLFVTEESEQRRQRKIDEESQRRLQALEKVALFEPLTDEERHQLAERLQTTFFVKGEMITRQGAAAHHLYMMSRGSAEVRVADPSGVSQRVAILNPGDFFGEMGLMTGSPRSATIIALADCHCYRLDKEAFNEVLQRRPEIAEGISHILARRRAELDAVRENLSEEALRQRTRSTEGDLLRRIRDFFRLGA